MIFGGRQGEVLGGSARYISIVLGVCFVLPAFNPDAVRNNFWYMSMFTHFTNPKVLSSNFSKAYSHSPCTKGSNQQTAACFSWLEVQRSPSKRIIFCFRVAKIVGGEDGAIRVVVIFEGGGGRGIYGSVIFKAQCDQSEILKFIIQLQHQLMEVKLQQNIYGQNCEEESVQNKTSGSWTFNENLLYVVFLQKNKVIMQSKKKRKNLRIFDQMSEFVDTRTSLQCRSHHQKFLEKLGDIKTIITNFKKFISKEDFRAKYQEIMGKRKGPGEFQGGVKTEQMEEEVDAGAEVPEETAKGEQNSCSTQQKTVRQHKEKQQNATSNSQHQIQEEEQKSPGFKVRTPQPRQSPFVVMDNSYANIPLINMYLQSLMQLLYL